MSWSKEEFESKFFDIRQHRPKKGQVLAQYKAVAYFVNGWVKENIIGILKTNSIGAETAQKVMTNMVGAEEGDGIKVLLEMAKDLQSGMSDEDVLKKEYKMIVGYNYWTERDNVPKDDPHWFTIDLLDIDDRMKSTYSKGDINIPIENERKFILLESPIIEKLFIEKAEQTLRIEQKYLSIERGFSVRVRLSINNGLHSHPLTVKKDVGGQVVEIETLISEDDFRKLWTKGYNKVTKTRYIYQGWEIDFFKDSIGKNYLAVAEIELLPIQKEPEFIPNLIKNLIIFCVPIKDKRFSNKKIGDVKYATRLLNRIKIRSKAHLLEQPDLKLFSEKLK